MLKNTVHLAETITEIISHAITKLANLNQEHHQEYLVNVTSRDLTLSHSVVIAQY